MISPAPASLASSSPWCPPATAAPTSRRPTPAGRAPARARAGPREEGICPSTGTGARTSLEPSQHDPTRTTERCPIMGTAENVELVRRGDTAFNSGDMATLSDMFAEDAVWHVDGS